MTRRCKIEAKPPEDHQHQTMWEFGEKGDQRISTASKWTEAACVERNFASLSQFGLGPPFSALPQFRWVQLKQWHTPDHSVTGHNHYYMGWFFIQHWVSNNSKILRPVTRNDWGYRNFRISTCRQSRHPTLSEVPEPICWSDPLSAQQYVIPACGSTYVRTTRCK